MGTHLRLWTPDRSGWLWVAFRRRCPREGIAGGRLQLSGRLRTGRPELAVKGR
ncbi:hypothetical protein GCM10010169_11660 [Micromonospora fulviviridis]|nr:hypothetical protein GCM10010169_11660 [Micromonospora fulviviridis]